MTTKTRELVPTSTAPSPVSGKRTAQAHPAQAAYSINHVKFMVPPEGRPSIPIENAGSSKQNGRSCAGNNERRSQTTRNPDHQTWRGQRKILRSTKIRPIISDHIDRPDNINHGNLIALTIDPIVCGFHLTRAPMGINSSPNLLRQDTVHQIGIDRSRIKPTKNIFSKMSFQV